MANPFVKAWKYFMSWFGAQVDERADPKIQIQQAIEEAQRQHEALSRQAAAVIGNQRQLEMKLSRQMSDVERLQASARQALTLADQARAKGDEAKAQEYEQTAQVFATQLVSAESSMEDLKGLHDQALQAAEQAERSLGDLAAAPGDAVVRAELGPVRAGAAEAVGTLRRLAGQVTAVEDALDRVQVGRLGPSAGTWRRRWRRPAATGCGPSGSARWTA